MRAGRMATLQERNKEAVRWGTRGLLCVFVRVLMHGVGQESSYLRQPAGCGLACTCTHLFYYPSPRIQVHPGCSLWQDTPRPVGNSHQQQ